MQKIVPTVYQQSNYRLNFRFRRLTTVRELRPTAISSDGKCIRYREFSQFIANVGRIYETAINELGRLDQLHLDTLVPAMDNGAAFPDRVSKEIVYIKADRVQNAMADRNGR